MTTLAAEMWADMEGGQSVGLLYIDGDHHFDAVLLQEPQLLIRRVVIRHHRADGIEFSHAHVGAPPEFGVVCDQDHPIRRGDHGGLDVRIHIAWAAEAQILGDARH